MCASVLLVVSLNGAIVLDFVFFVFYGNQTGTSRTVTTGATATRSDRSSATWQSGQVLWHAVLDAVDVAALPAAASKT